MLAVFTPMVLLMRRTENERAIIQMKGASGIVIGKETG